MNWSKVCNRVPESVIQDFVTQRISYNTFYRHAVGYGVGPEVRTLKLRGAKRARKAAREALRRRGSLVTA